MTTAYLQIYRQFQASGMQDKIGNWNNLITYSQYKKAFETTLSKVSSNSKVLDWGCGNGHFSYFLILSGFRPVGYSYETRPAIFSGESRFTFVPGTEGEPTHLPFGDGEFDAVFSIGVLEHVHQFGGDPVGSVRELHRVVKQGGLFLCFHLPNRFTWIEFIARLVRRGGSSIHVHDKLYDRKRIEDLLLPNGFKLLEAGRYAFLPRGIFRRAPRFIRDSTGTALLINFVDDVLNALFGVFSQNWYFVAIKE